MSIIINIIKNILVVGNNSFDHKTNKLKQNDAINLVIHTESNYVIFYQQLSVHDFGMGISIFNNKIILAVPIVINVHSFLFNFRTVKSIIKKIIVFFNIYIYNYLIKNNL